MIFPGIGATSSRDPYHYVRQLSRIERCQREGAAAQKNDKVFAKSKNTPMQLRPSIVAMSDASTLVATSAL